MQVLQLYIINIADDKSYMLDQKLDLIISNKIQFSKGISIFLIK
jgi:hypothetical protein